MNSPTLHQTAPYITSIESLRVYGVSKCAVLDATLNSFHIPKNLSKCFQYYNIHKWESLFTLASIKEGVLTNSEGKSFIVVYSNCTRFKVKSSKDCLLSFREAKEEYNLPAYVLIKPAKLDNKREEINNEKL